VVIPTLLCILPEQCDQMGGHHLCDHKAATAIYSFLRWGLVEIFYVSASFLNVIGHVAVVGIEINCQISSLF
jgi:hypothetical protein